MEPYADAALTFYALYILLMAILDQLTISFLEIALFVALSVAWGFSLRGWGRFSRSERCRVLFPIVAILAVTALLIGRALK